MRMALLGHRWHIEIVRLRTDLSSKESVNLIHWRLSYPIPGLDLGGGATGAEAQGPPQEGGIHNTNFWVKFPIEWYTTLTRSMYIA